MKRVFLDRGCMFEGEFEELIQIQMVSKWKELVQK